MNAISEIICFIIDYVCRLHDVAQSFTLKGDDLFWGRTELPFWFEGKDLMMITINKFNYGKAQLGHIDNIDDFLLALNQANLDIVYKGAYEITYDPDGDSEICNDFCGNNKNIYYLDEEQMEEFGEKINGILDNIEI